MKERDSYTMRHIQTHIILSSALKRQQSSLPCTIYENCVRNAEVCVIHNCFACFCVCMLFFLFFFLFSTKIYLHILSAIKFSLSTVHMYTTNNFLFSLYLTPKISNMSRIHRILINFY